eukprot:gene11473-34189_t
MSTVKVGWSHLPLQGALISSQQNLCGTRLATSTEDDSQSSEIQIWEPGLGQGEWNLLSQIQTPDPIVQFVWAHQEFGFLLSGCSSSGGVYVWEAPRPQDSKANADEAAAVEDEEMNGEDEPEWKQRFGMKCSTAPISDLVFVPRQLGLALAVASEDGNVCVLEAERPMAPNAWALQSKFMVSSKKGPVCLAWRPFTPCLAPLLVVGSTEGAQVWQYLPSFMKWQKVVALPLSSSAHGVSSLHWAPTLGRQVDLLAVAHGCFVDIFSLAGSLSSQDKLNCELLASLEHSSNVWKVEFNMLGNCLASATDCNHVHLWKSDFVGAWQLVSVIQGAEDAEEAEA